MMRNAAVLIGWVALAAGLWWLYPPRPLNNRIVEDPALIEITYDGPGGVLGEELRDVADAFERRSVEAHRADPTQPIYRVVNGQSATREQASDPTRFMVSVAGGTPPDVMLYDRFALAEWAARGVFEPLDGFLDKDQGPEKIHPEDYYRSCWDVAHYRGKLYGIPWNADDRALYYNVDLLKRAGLVDEHGNAKPPRNWDELREYGRRLTERDDRGNLSVIGFAPNFGNSWLYMYTFMNDANFMNADCTRVTLASPGVVEALKYIRSCYDDAGGYEAVNAFSSAFQHDALDPFILGKVAMKIDGMEALRTIGQFGRDTNVAIAPPPRPLGKEGKPITWSGGFALAMPSAARHKQAAWEFMRFVASDAAYHIAMESGRENAEVQGRIYLPDQYPRPELNTYALNKFVAGNPEIPLKFQDALKAFNELMPYATYRPVTPVGQLLWNEQVTATEAALMHRLSPEDALATSAAIVQRQLDSVLQPPHGYVIASWSWLPWLVAALTVIAGVLIYRWDTSTTFRIAIARPLGLQRKVGDVVPGAATGSFARKQWIGGWVCAAPWFIGFIVLSAGPMLFSLVISLCNYDIVQPARLIGFENYRVMFSADRLVPLAIWNTLAMALSVPLAMAVSLAMAMLLNQPIRGMRVWRTLFYLPAIVPLVATCMLWIWLLTPQGGLINEFLHAIGLHGPRWLQSPQWSKPALILMTLWSAGSGMIIWLAGLKGIPASLYEAASLDGANGLQQFFMVTIPQLTPYIFFNLLMGLIGTLQIFEQAYIMTAGGPDNSTLFYVYHLFNNAFAYGRMGYASAMAWVLLIVVLLLTATQMRFSKRWVHYGDEA